MEHILKSRFENHPTETLIRYHLACQRTLVVLKSENITQLIVELQNELSRRNETVCNFQE